MLFQSQGFILIFLPLAVAAYYAVAGSERARQAVLITASLVFYGWWDARFLILGQTGKLVLGVGRVYKRNPVIAGWLGSISTLRHG